MSLTARILLAFGIMALGGLFLVLNPTLDRVERQVLEAAEEPMVDTAEILAAWVSRELQSSQTPPANLALAFTDLQDRSLAANIYDLTKTEVSMDVYLTDARGVVLFDSGNPTRVGINYSHFADVGRTLRGEYGARSTREDPEDDSTSVMHVAAPLIVGGVIVGVLTVYKPQQSLRVFVNETRRRLWWVGGAGIVIFLLIGIGLSRWVTAPLAALTQHAEAVSAGERPVDLDLRAVVRRVCEREQALHDRVSIRWSGIGGGDDVATVVRGDEFLLETAVVNLVQNAVDFSDEGGLIEVSVEVDHESGRARVRVADHGTGIPDYAVEKIFSRFYSLPRPGSGRKSSGLGLCLVSEIARLHGGRVTLQNRTDGPGAEAALELPM